MSYRPRIWNPYNKPTLYVKRILPKWLLKHYKKYYW